MGGHPAGEVASRLAVAAVQEFLLNSGKRSSDPGAGEGPDALQDLEGAFLHASARVCEGGAKHPEYRGMGTTLTLAVAWDWQLFLAHAGHSRCYLMSRGQLRQLTQDHTVAAELVTGGVVSPGDAARHPYRRVLTKFLGAAQPAVRAELHRADLRPGDVVLVCSDGLTEVVSAERLAAILRAEREPRRACERLVAEANERGGAKNVTAVVARMAAGGV
jgi:protein phosphatase